MNGAESVLRTLAGCGVDLCLANPGTTEIHLVAALEAAGGLRGVLALEEGVATGAADGYARMAERPASVLLHLGPGLGNGLANLHNARRARSPVVTLVGDHATWHGRNDPPLQSDIEAVAGSVSAWVRRSARADEAGLDAADAVAAAVDRRGVATLVLPADVAWSEGATPAGPRHLAGRPVAAAATIEEAARHLRGGGPAALLLGGAALRRRGLIAAGAVAATCGARLLAETFPARLERGAGIPAVERLSYLADFADLQLAGLRHLVVVDAAEPVAFFAAPGRPGRLAPEGCEVHVLTGPGDDVPGTLEALAAAVGAVGGHPAGAAPGRPERPTGGALTAEAVGAALGALLPEGAVVSDEANTSGLFLPGPTAGAPSHDWLCLTGGAIGQGLPVAVGAALACPGRRVIALEADGSAMYTPQALWTMARESLDVTVLVLANRAYSILTMELDRYAGGAGGAPARALLDLRRPDLDFVALATSMGVPATRPATAGELVRDLEAALSEAGPRLVECVVPPVL